jgi:hypothetical protein
VGRVCNPLADFQSAAVAPVENRRAGYNPAPPVAPNLLGLQLEVLMPDKKALERARKDKQEGKAPSTQAGEFVREEMDHVREGKHGVTSNKQAVAIGLSKARRAGVKLAAPKKGQASETTRRKAAQDTKRGRTSSLG